MAHPQKISGLILISLEDIEDDQAKETEVAFFAQFAKTLRRNGLKAAWESVLPYMAPVIGDMVRQGISRSDAGSILAATAIVHDRAFSNVKELDGINMPMLIIPGDDSRHPAALSAGLAASSPERLLSSTSFFSQMKSAGDFAKALSPIIGDFLSKKIDR